MIDRACLPRKCRMTVVANLIAAYVRGRSPRGSRTVMTTLTRLRRTFEHPSHVTGFAFHRKMFAAQGKTGVEVVKILWRGENDSRCQHQNKQTRHQKIVNRLTLFFHRILVPAIEASAP